MKLYTKLYISLCTKLYTKLCIKLYIKLYAKPLCVRATYYYWVPAIFPIASIRASAKYTPYIHLGSHLIFYPFLYPPYLGRH